MADITGTSRETLGGKAVVLRLTWGVLAELQAVHGDDFLSRLQMDAGKTPSFGLMIDIVARAIIKGMALPEAEARAVADDLLTNDAEVLARLLAATFPDAVGKPAAAATAA